MRFEFIADEHVKVKTFLKKHEVSKGLLAKIKFRGGAILVNDQPQMQLIYWILETALSSIFLLRKALKL